MIDTLLNDRYKIEVEIDKEIQIVTFGDGASLNQGNIIKGKSYTHMANERIVIQRIS